MSFDQIGYDQSNVTSRGLLMRETPVETVHETRSSLWFFLQDGQLCARKWNVSVSGKLNSDSGICRTQSTFRHYNQNQSHLNHPGHNGRYNDFEFSWESLSNCSLATSTHLSIHRDIQSSMANSSSIDHQPLLEGDHDSAQSESRRSRESMLRASRRKWMIIALVELVIILVSQGAVYVSTRPHGAPYSMISNSLI